MFTQLRNRFLIVNLVIISFMMLMAFAAIYTITYQDVRRDITMELRKVSEFYNRPDGMSGSGSPRSDRGRPPQEFDDMGGGGPQRSVSFALQTDGQHNLISLNSRFDMDSAFYDQAIQEAAAASEGEGQFTLDGTTWAYTLQPNTAGYFFVFLDVTAQQTIVTNLIYTFLAVGSVMLIVIFFTSRFFANRSIRPVQEAFDKQKQFIADASHELKTPLAVINTNADVLLANSEDTIRSQAKWLHYIKSETERMKTLTNDLLYLTEMNDTRAAVIHTTVDLSEAVESVVLTMEAAIFEKDLSLSCHIDPGLTVRGSSEQLQQVVMILLDNAMKYSNPKGLITLALKKRSTDVQLTVTNTGEGIPPEHLGRIFDRFYRADPSRSRKHGGYGLGLAIAKSIIEQHKGKIYAKSVPNEVTTFYVQLP